MILRAVSILFLASTAAAAATDCKTISDPTARLACFDAPKAGKKPARNGKGVGVRLLRDYSL
jgi:hypothetical protein